MARKRDLITENKRILLGGLLVHLRYNRSGYGGCAALAADQLIEEFARRSRIVTGPPPGHAPLPGLEPENTADRCDPSRGYHSTPHRGCILR